MKILHLSDLHLGKYVNGYSMLEDQSYILAQILNIIDQEETQAVLIAGDVYDKAVPGTEAVQLFDDFLVKLSARGQKVFVISGNHDSPERLSFAGRLMKESGVYMAPVYHGKTEPVLLCDEYGELAVYMLPFLKPVNVRRFFPEQEISSYTDALRTAIQQMEIRPERRNILVTHQFVTGALRCDSEEISVGGTDNVDASVFEAFDYTALGHIHNPQNVGTEKIRYCGTPLKYSFSEASGEKSVTIIQFAEKGNQQVKTIPLSPKRDLKELKGSYEELTYRPFYDGTVYPDSYVHITLTNEEDIPDGVLKLRTIYPFLMKLDYDNRRTRHNAVISGAEAVENKSAPELFEEFYESQNGTCLSPEQSDFVKALIERIWEEK